MRIAAYLSKCVILTTPTKQHISILFDLIHHQGWNHLCKTFPDPWEWNLFQNSGNTKLSLDSSAMSSWKSEKKHIWCVRSPWR